MGAMTDTGAAVRLWRSGCGLTQEQAARRLGVTMRNFQNYEWGKYPPPETVRRLMTAIAQGLDLAPWDLDAAHQVQRRPLSR